MNITKMNRNKRPCIIGYGVTACVFVAITLWMSGMLGRYTGAEMAVWLLGLYLITPTTSLIIGVYLGVKNAFLKWLYPVIFGIWGFVIPCLATGNFKYETISLFFSFVPALLGIVVGISIRKFRATKNAAT